MTLRTVDARELDLTQLIRSGDLVSWGQATAEPLGLIETYLQQRHAIGRTRAFVGLSLSGVLKPEHADRIDISSYGALGTLGPLCRDGHVQIIPCRYSALPALVRNGKLRPDVLFIRNFLPCFW